MHNIAFIGFGEAGSCFAGALRRGGAAVSAYDLLYDDPDGREDLRRRCRDLDIRLAGLAEALGDADLVISTVTTDVAAEAAQACLPHLRAGQVYFDLNATAPAVKRDLGRLIADSGADFVEGAVLGAVGVSGAATKILAAGSAAEDLARRLNARGLNVDFYGTEIGRASTFKMLRSVFSKGLEALLLEGLIAARRAGLQQEVWREITGLFAAHSFEAVADNWIRSHAAAHERRGHEMRQVAGVLRELDLEPVISDAVAAFFARSGEAGLAPDDGDTVAALDRRRGSEGARGPSIAESKVLT